MTSVFGLSIAHVEYRLFHMIVKMWYSTGRIAGPWRHNVGQAVSPMLLSFPVVGIRPWWGRAMPCQVRHEPGYNFAPKASSLPSQSFTTNSRVCHGVSTSPRVNSTPRDAYSA